MGKKVGILTWHYYPNFGSALQAYALQEALHSIGCHEKVIDYRSIKYGKILKFKIDVKYALGKIFHKFFYVPFLAFQKDYMSLSLLTQNEKNLRKEVERLDAVVCGSDQIWAPNVFNPVYMANFVDGKTVCKISYAASIGLNYIPNKLVSQYKYLLSDFKAISVREEKGKDLLFKKCGITAKVVLDPTLLLTASEYRKMEKNVLVNGKFIFCYFLKADNDYQRTVLNSVETNKYKIVGCSAKKSDVSWMNIQENIGPCEFLWLIDHAEAVFTDSYHGTIFSLLFHKEFWTFERFKPDDEICQNSRIQQLDYNFGIGGRIIQSDSSIQQCPAYSFDEFEVKLKILRKDSLDFLKEALE